MATTNGDNAIVTGKNLRRAIKGLLAKIKEVDNSLNGFISNNFSKAQESNSEEIFGVESSLESIARFCGWVFHGITNEIAGSTAEQTVCVTAGKGKRIWSSSRKSFVYFDTMKIVVDEVMTKSVTQDRAVALLMDNSGNVSPYEYSGSGLVAQSSSLVNPAIWPLNKLVKAAAENIVAKQGIPLGVHVDMLIKSDILTSEKIQEIIEADYATEGYTILSTDNKIYQIAYIEAEDGSGKVKQLLPRKSLASRIYVTDLTTRMEPSAQSFTRTLGLWGYDKAKQAFKDIVSGDTLG